MSDGSHNLPTPGVCATQDSFSDRCMKYTSDNIVFLFSLPAHTTLTFIRKSLSRSIYENVDNLVKLSRVAEYEVL